MSGIVAAVAHEADQTLTRRYQPVDDEATLRTSPIRIDDGPAGYDDDREIPGGLEPGLSTAATSSGKKFKIRQPSKLEQKIMADARQRQRDHITTTQVVQGKEYKGSGFAAAPSTIDFVDFDVGVPMSKRFVLTNVSLTFNSFKSRLFSCWSAPELVVIGFCWFSPAVVASHSRLL